MSSCQCLKSNGQPCTRTVSYKTGHNSLYCWQHQSCTSQVSNPIIVPKLKTPITTPLSKPKTPIALQLLNPIDILANHLEHKNISFYTQLLPAVLNELIVMINGCPKHKFKNPNTNKCVNISSPTGTKIITKLIQKHKPKPQPYMSILGQSQHLDRTHFGQHILGQGELDFALQPTDPDFDAIYQTTRYIWNPNLLKETLLPKKFNAEVLCLGGYQSSMISFDSIDEIIKQNKTNVIVSGKKCFIVSDYIDFWRHALTTIDPQSSRVKPQYPIDLVTGEPMLPEDICKIVNRGIKLKLVESKETDALWYLTENHEFLTDIYSFIRLKTKLSLAYSQIKDPNQGTWNRRDLLLARELKTLYTKYHLTLPSYGWRLYTDIYSGNKSVQVFETCLIVAKLVQKFVLTLIESENQTYLWLPRLSKDDRCSDYVKSYSTKNPCRPCVSYDIITSDKDKINL